MEEILSLNKSDLDYFNRGEFENKKFFSRLNGEPDFTGLKVLDIGCGHGSLCVHIGLREPQKIIGIDIDEHRVEFAQNNMQKNFPNLSNRVEFKILDIENLDEYDFDIIVSKDSFEHIVSLEKCLQEIIKRLKSGGKLYLGFGPLYNSYYGDHKRTGSIIPWGHILRSDENIIRSINRKRPNNEKINSICDLGLNKYSLKQYEELINNCGLKILFWGTNVSKHPVLKLFTQIAKINFLREFFTHNIYCILEK